MPVKEYGNSEQNHRQEQSLRHLSRFDEKLSEKVLKIATQDKG